jgi:hypothetical protein
MKDEGRGVDGMDGMDGMDGGWDLDGVEDAVLAEDGA